METDSINELRARNATAMASLFDLLNAAEAVVTHGRFGSLEKLAEVVSRIDKEIRNKEIRK